MANDQFLTTDEACFLLSVSRWQLWRMRVNGIIPPDAYIRFGKCGQVRYNLKALRKAWAIDDKQTWEYYKQTKAKRKVKHDEVRG